MIVCKVLVIQSFLFFFFEAFIELVFGRHVGAQNRVDERHDQQRDEQRNDETEREAKHEIGIQGGDARLYKAGAAMPVAGGMSGTPGTSGVPVNSGYRKEL